MEEKINPGPNSKAGLLVGFEKWMRAAATKPHKIESLNEHPLWRRSCPQHVGFEMVIVMDKIAKAQSGLPLRADPSVRSASVTMTPKFLLQRLRKRSGRNSDARIRSIASHNV